MKPQQRQLKILDILHHQGKVNVTELVETFGVSAESIRRDLTALSSAGKLQKIHGGATISSLIGGRVGNTMMMAGLVAVISIPISVALGLWAAMHPATLLDRIVTFGTLSLISVPEFFIATVAVLILAVNLHWLPSTAYMTGDETFGQLMKALAMPLITLVIVVSAQMIRMTRAGILNVMSSPYIEMAILKGVPRGRIILRHAFFNAIGPIINVIALNLAYLVSGVVIVETIFQVPGLGQHFINATTARDYTMLQGVVIFFGFLIVLANLAADLVLVMLNPRLKES